MWLLRAICERGGRAVLRGDVWRERAVDEAFVRAALLPDAGVDAAFDQDGLVVAGNGVDVAGEVGEGGVPGALPAGIVVGKARDVAAAGGLRVRRTAAAAPAASAASLRKSLRLVSPEVLSLD